MIHIDGSIGEGGGQILRTALGLSMRTGQPFTIDRIRAGRPKPGLMRQHLTAVHAATQISGATVEGDVIGSQRLVFSPGSVRAGDYQFVIGSAGSTTLVLQAVLPALLNADAPSTLTIEGGTHNPLAPPVDFLRDAFLPLVRKMGPTVEVNLLRAGFFPAGGGKVQVNISPGTWSPLVLVDRGELVSRRAVALFAQLPVGIAKRELARVQKRLEFEASELKIFEIPADQGPGNTISITATCANVTEVFVGFAERGVNAEKVADGAIDLYRTYMQGTGAVGPYLADQLLVPMALAGGGEMTLTEVTAHTTTNAQVIEQFLPVKVSITQSTATSPARVVVA
jgi:RNA 3'-terminal phosphate cyclase (ATP)